MYVRYSIFCLFICLTSCLRFVCAWARVCAHVWACTTQHTCKGKRQRDGVSCPSTFTWVQLTELRASGLRGKHFDHWAILPAGLDKIHQHFPPVFLILLSDSWSSAQSSPPQQRQQPLSRGSLHLAFPCCRTQPSCLYLAHVSSSTRFMCELLFTSVTTAFLRPQAHTPWSPLGSGSTAIFIYFVIYLHLEGNSFHMFTCRSDEP